jgi:SpoVK/Ycf46/Vps4 family AAA+-type ATPase
MRSLDLQVASVHFDEIGGQSSVKQRLREAVEWPLKYPERMARLGVRPPKVMLNIISSYL